jgi:indole-3-glycerol phosphate synthase/phosphoribosylanthranilate isomerase
VTADEAAPLAGMARKAGIFPVGVFRNAPLDTVVDLATLLNLHAVQLHGREDEEYIDDLRRELGPQCEIWSAVSVEKDGLLSRPGDRLVFDNKGGGTGQCFDWDRVRDHPRLSRSLVAGGIGSANALAAQRLGAYAIDVGSSLDLRPGVKSPERIASLFDMLRPLSRRRRACA